MSCSLSQSRLSRVGQGEENEDEAIAPPKQNENLLTHGLSEECSYTCPRFDVRDSRMDRMDGKRR